MCEKAGFDYIEIRIDMLKEYLQENSLQTLKDFFSTHNLKPHALNAIYLDSDMFTENETEKCKQIVKDFIFCCNVATRIGSEHIIVVPPMNREDKREFTQAKTKILEDCTRILKKLSEIALEYNIKICFELVGAPWCSVRTTEFAKKIVDTVNLKNVGYVFDSYNMFLHNRLNNFEVLTTIPVEQIFAVHINDAEKLENEQYTQQHRCFCGKGILNLDNYLSTLAEIGYNGMVSIELFRPEYWEKTAEWVINTAYQTTKESMQKYI